MSALGSGAEFEAWAESMREEYDAFLPQTWAAMQAVLKGHRIEGTEEHLREAGEALRPKAMEKLLQVRSEPEQSPSSPSAGSGLGKQRLANAHAPDGDGACNGAAARWRAGRAGG
jgi:hypothetical protein